MADFPATTRAYPLTVPGSGKTQINATKWISFANSGTQVLIIDTPGGDLATSILLPSGMWQIPAIAIYSTTTVTAIVGYE